MKGRTKAGDIQVMSAGRGVYHSEYNLEDQPSKIFQIWIEPKERGIEPDWDSASFHQTSADNQLSLLVSGDGEAPLYINQDAYIYGGQLQKDSKVVHPIKHQAYILAAKGAIEGEGIRLEEGDGAEVTHQQQVEIKALGEGEVIILDVPEK
jgi:redox-sensitive bicupin YhaK (pirin superfamily)